MSRPVSDADVCLTLDIRQGLRSDSPRLGLIPRSLHLRRTLRDREYSLESQHSTLENNSRRDSNLKHPRGAIDCGVVIWPSS